MTTAPILETRQASLVYGTPRGPITAVDQVSLAIAPGEFVAILGRSGSGKSTLLALLGGLCQPTAGEAMIAGRTWRERTAAEITTVRARDVGMLLQDGGLLPGLRALDNVLLPMVLAGRNHAASTSRAEDLLGLVGLRDRWDAYPAELSGGQQRRVALVRALAAEPAVILADEPTGDLDGLAARQIIAVLAGLRLERSTAIVVATHDPALAAIADRRMWMERGRCTQAVADGASALSPTIASPGAAEHAPAAVFEAAPSGLVAQRPASGVGGLVRSWVPFLAGIAICAAGIALIDGIVARKQHVVVQASRLQRRLAEEMAMQDLRADVDDVIIDEAGRATIAIYLQNYRPERPLHVLGPSVEVGVQREGRWENVRIDVEAAPGGIHSVAGGKTFIPVRFTVPKGRYDELLLGYLHVRIGAGMVVSDRPDGTGDLFERQDAYYVYLRDPQRTEAEIRRANGWGEKATVPLWISMPSH